MKTVDVMIPTYKPGEKFVTLIQMLEKQTYPINCIRVVNTEECFWKESYEELSGKMEVSHVDDEYFDHGRTRDFAARFSTADYVVFMTQDAVPADEFLIENLVGAMEQDPKIAVAYARQLPNVECSPIERFTRQFNYPDQSVTKSKKDIPEMGIKTFFCSNVCAIYDLELYLATGGFEKKIIFNEDMVYAGHLIKQGYKVAYCAEAMVIHSHNYTALQQFHRNFDMGVSQADHPEVFGQIKSEKEGIHLVWQITKWLKKEKERKYIIVLFWQSGWKYLGYLLGKKYKSLPSFFIRMCSMNKMYWYL